ncbi:MAG: hypothetical protein ACK443_07305 [Methylococcaceae bacterium]|jgi:hypothetical protein
MSNSNAGLPSEPAWIRGFRLPLNARRLVLLVSISLLIVFPDVAILIILKLVYFTVSWLSLQFKHALQDVFDLSRHGAQMITAWLEVAVLIALSVGLFRKLRKVLRERFSRKREESRC